MHWISELSIILPMDLVPNGSFWSLQLDTSCQEAEHDEHENSTLFFLSFGEPSLQTWTNVTMHSPPDPYNFDNARGWRSYRVLRPGRGMYHDIKRRLPYYPSDITDALTYRTFASTVRIYFVKLVLPSLLVLRCP